MYAIIRTGGRQYRAEVGAEFDVERLPNDVNDSIEITDVLMIGDGENSVVGQPTVKGASVNVTVIEQFRAPKIIVFKYRQRTKYRVKRGHRQYYTRVRVDSINV